MPERVLVVGPAWVGDMVMAQSLFRFLKADRPGVTVDVLAPAWSLPLLARMPEVHEGIHLPLGHGQLGLLARYRLGRTLRECRYDQAIVLPRSFKAALVPFFAHARRRTGYRGEMRYGLINDRRPLDRQALPMVVQRYLNLGLREPGELPAIPYPKLSVDRTRAETLLQNLGLDSERPAVAIAPGAEYGPAKQWPATQFAALAAKLTARGCQVWVVGSEKDRPVAESIAAEAGSGVANLCGRTALVEVVDLLSMARALVTNDSGLMHIGAAVGIPVVAIYGSSSPDYTPPLTPKQEVLYRGMACSPCFERTCRYGHYDCLQRIGTADVEHAVNRFLEKEPVVHED